MDWKMDVPAAERERKAHGKLEIKIGMVCKSSSEEAWDKVIQTKNRTVK